MERKGVRVARVAGNGMPMRVVSPTPVDLPNVGEFCYSLLASLIVMCTRWSSMTGKGLTDFRAEHTGADRMRRLNGFRGT